MGSTSAFGVPPSVESASSSPEQVPERFTTSPITQTAGGRTSSSDAGEGSPSVVRTVRWVAVEPSERADRRFRRTPVP